MMADSMSDAEKRKHFFKKIEDLTKGYDLKKQTPQWFSSDDERMGDPILVERSEAEKREQLLDKKLYTIYKVVNGAFQPVAWNVPRIEKDVMLVTVFRPRLVRITSTDGQFESEMSKFEAFPSDQVPSSTEPTWAE